MEKSYKLQEASKITGISYTTLVRMINPKDKSKAAIPAHRIGGERGHWAITENTLLKLQGKAPIEPTALSKEQEDLELLKIRVQKANLEKQLKEVTEPKPEPKPEPTKETKSEYIKLAESLKIAQGQLTEVEKQLNEKKKELEKVAKDSDSITKKIAKAQEELKGIKDQISQAASQVPVAPAESANEVTEAEVKELLACLKVALSLLSTVEKEKGKAGKLTYSNLRGNIERGREIVEGWLEPDTNNEEVKS